jgi:hypothetical protein
MDPHSNAKFHHRNGIDRGSQSDDVSGLDWADTQKDAEVKQLLNMDQPGGQLMEEFSVKYYKSEVSKNWILRYLTLPACYREIDMDVFYARLRWMTVGVEQEGALTSEVLTMIGADQSDALAQAAIAVQ